MPNESFFEKNRREGHFFSIQRHLRARFRGAKGSCQRQLVEMFPALTLRGAPGAGGASPASPLRGLVFWGRMVPGFRCAAPGATIRRPTGYEQGRRMCGSWCARACPGAADSRSARNNAVGQSPTARIGRVAVCLLHAAGIWNETHFGKTNPILSRPGNLGKMPIDLAHNTPRATNSS